MGEHGGSSDDALVEIELDTVDGARELWTTIVASLRSAGFADVGPEYLRLSEILRQAHAAELLNGAPDAAEWAHLQAAGREAVDHLGPLVAAAKILADLPVGDVVEPAPAAAPARNGATRRVAAVRSTTSRPARTRSAPARRRT